MNIKPILRCFINEGSLGAFAAIAIGGIVAHTVHSSINCDKNTIKTCRQEIAQKDPSRLDRLDKKLKVLDGAFYSLPEQAKACKEEMNNMRDSLYIDSLCQEAYFKGQQSVRDSLATITKEN